MIEIKAPKLTLLQETEGLITLFMAGGISNCPLWQNEMLDVLSNNTGLMVFNPRREFFDVNNPEIEEEQIKWEYYHLSLSDIIMFWFPKETVCPITLYELGRWATSGKKICVGHHPEYSRRNDLRIQLGLIDPSIRITQSFEELGIQIAIWSNWLKFKRKKS